MAEPIWLESTSAAQHLGISVFTLKRRRDTHGGYLESGKHYRFKTDAVNSPILWRVDVIADLFHQRAVKARQEAQQ